MVYVSGRMGTAYVTGVQQYVPGYCLKTEPVFDEGRSGLADPFLDKPLSQARTPLP